MLLSSIADIRKKLFGLATQFDSHARNCHSEHREESALLWHQAHLQEIRSKAQNERVRELLG